MKKVLVLVVVLSLGTVSGLFAQTKQGQWLLGISSRYSFNPIGISISMPDMMSLGYTTLKFKSDDSDSDESDKYLCLNMTPKFGYFVIDNLAVGIDLQLGGYSMKYADDDKDNGTLLSGGLLVRYYFPSGNVFPFVEAGGATGAMNTKYEYDNEVEKNKSSVNSWTLGGGVSIPISEKAAFDLMLGYLSTTMKNKEDNPDNEKYVMGTFGIKFGIVVFLGAGKELSK